MLKEPQFIYNLYRMFTSTKKNEKYWKDRKVDWKQAYWNPEHPHRDMIIEELKRFSFKSIFEMGCACGANLYRIHQEFPWAEFGGMDANADAITLAKQMLPRAQILDVGHAEDIYFSDKSIDIVMTDATLIYTGRDRINKTMDEMVRIARNGVLFCEFHSDKWWKRLDLEFGSHLHAYDYNKLLKERNCYDIKITKIPKEAWPILPWETFGYIISARL